MNLLRAAVVTIAASSVAIATWLFIRRQALDGGYFNDGDRAAGCLGSSR